MTGSRQTVPRGGSAPAAGAEIHLLVACSGCGRQWDAAGHRAGERFHCACGQAIDVPEVRAVDAAVIRCGQCGAARRSKAASCDFCSADFTIHERDLHTICPGCMARISDRARFCHHCGLTIRAEGGIGEAADRICPSCGGERQLYRRVVGEGRVALDECHACAGMWLATGVLDGLLAETRRGAPSLPLSPPSPAPLEDRREPGRALYRPCPECSKLMHRQNFGRRSGVIVDACREHGMWFDRDELDHVLAWVRGGGETVAARIATEQAREAERRARSSSPGPLLAEPPSAEWRPAADLVGALLSWLTR